MRMNTLVSHAQSGLAVHEYVLRSGSRRAYTGVRAAWPMMGIFRDARLISEPRLRAHSEMNITHTPRFGSTKWR
jgi:hypothetical protein